MEMSRFGLTVCLNALHSKDGQPFEVAEAGSLVVGGVALAADNVVQRALPSQTAAAIGASMDAAPSFAHSLHLLVGLGVDHNAYGDLVAQQLVRSFSPHQHDRPGYEECLLFAFNGSSFLCETLTRSDDARTVESALSALERLSLVVFKFEQPQMKTAALLLTPQLSTAHMASLLISPRRHLFLYVDGSMLAEEVIATVTETEVLRNTLMDFGRPTATNNGVRRLADDGLPEIPLLNALAPSEESYHAWVQALIRSGPPDLRLVDGSTAELNMSRPVGHPHTRHNTTAALTVEERARSCSGDEVQQLRQDVAHLTHDLHEARKGRLFVEEKLRLMDFREKLRLTGGCGGGGVGVVAVAMGAEQPTHRNTTEDLQATIQQLKAEASEKEAEWRMRLRDAYAELAAAEATNAEMENTLALQAQTIAEAKQAIAHFQRTHETELNEVLSKVRTLSQPRRRATTSEMEDELL